MAKKNGQKTKALGHFKMQGRAKAEKARVLRERVENLERLERFWLDAARVAVGNDKRRKHCNESLVRVVAQKERLLEEWTALVDKCKCKRRDCKRVAKAARIARNALRKREVAACKRASALLREALGG